MRLIIGLVAKHVRLTDLRKHQQCLLSHFELNSKTDDLVAGKDALEPSHWLSHREALEKFPMLRHRGLKGGTVYYDGQMNDSRMCLAVAQTAIAHGAACANHVEVTELMHNTDGRVCGARVRDQISGAQWAIRAKTVVNAGGPFADSIRNLDASGRSERSPAPMVSPSAGVHVLLPSRFSPTGMGLIAPSSDGRVLFLLPWQGSTIAGTTDSSAHITALPRPHDDEYAVIYVELILTLNFV
jgi:glycerol-3-phosphate dehydrogenase